MNKGNLIMSFGFLIIAIALILDKAMGILNETAVLIVYGLGVVLLFVGLIKNQQAR